MKKRKLWMMSLFIVLSSLCQSAVQAASESPLKIVVTIFPEYEWVEAVLGELASQTDATLLVENGIDLHSYQPSVDDIIAISEADLFIFVGGVSDTWAADAVRNSVNPHQIKLNLMEILRDQIREEELVEGMEAESDTEAGDEIEYDEHVWLSLRNAGMIVSAIADELSGLDPRNAAVYRENAQAYKIQLDALDQKYQAVVENATFDTVIFADRFPFRYLVDDYGVKYFAAFTGCSAESEASFETIAFLARKMDELGLNSILTIENSDQKIAKTILENTTRKNQSILVLDSLQSVTSEDVKNGKTYLSTMQSNLNVLAQALN